MRISPMLVDINTTGFLSAMIASKVEYFATLAFLAIDSHPCRLGALDSVEISPRVRYGLAIIKSLKA